MSNDAENPNRRLLPKVPTRQEEQNASGPDDIGHGQSSEKGVAHRASRERRLTAKANTPPSACSKPVSDPTDQRFPAGRPPWEPWNGARVGAIVGGLAGLSAALLLSMTNYLVVLVGAALGAAVGYWDAKRKQRPSDRIHG